MANVKLNQVWFARTLAEDIVRYNCGYIEARPVLVDYREVPKEMTGAEWHKVIEALRACCSSIKFLYKIAMLAEAKIISHDVLYILYYEELSAYLTEKLSFLIRWCGTGLDLAADYGPHELALMATSLIHLLRKLNAAHRKHGADLELEGYGGLIEDFEEKNRGFFSNPGRFDVCSDNYVDNYVDVIEWRFLPPFLASIRRENPRSKGR
jgi:hypothetical protein